jgi:hypothetical protein
MAALRTGRSLDIEGKRFGQEAESVMNSIDCRMPRLMPDPRKNASISLDIEMPIIGKQRSDFGGILAAGNAVEKLPGDSNVVALNHRNLFLQIASFQTGTRSGS